MLERDKIAPNDILVVYVDSGRFFPQNTSVTKVYVDIVTRPSKVAAKDFNCISQVIENTCWQFPTFNS